MFEGMLFEFRSVVSAPSFRNWVNQETVAAEPFVILDLMITNQTGGPLAWHFQPIFRLLDAGGAIYEPHQQHTMMINLQKSGRVPVAGENMNPNTPLRKELVFEVPKKKYELQVIVPNRARVGFGGSVTSSGLYFIYDIPSQLGGSGVASGPGGLPAPTSGSVQRTGPAVSTQSQAPIGQDSYSAERLARQLTCHSNPSATLVAKGPGYETFSVQCTNNDVLMIRCESGNCRALK
jgi:hypothetical protein